MSLTNEYSQTQMDTPPIRGVVEPMKRQTANRWLSIFRNWKSATGFVIIALFLVIAIFAPLIAKSKPQAEIYPLNLPPSGAHLLGTNSLGQDVFSQLVYGTRVSLLVAFAAGILTTFISLVVGITAGYLRGVADGILNWITNVFIVMPGLPLLIIVSSYWNTKSEWPIILIIAMTSWAYGARSLRAQTLTLRERDYVLHARLVGRPWWKVVGTEILPNMLSLVISGLLFSMIGALLAEAGLDFLGLGNVNTISWGVMLYWAQNNEAMVNGLWWWFVPPGAAIAIFGGALALINFSIDEITNPRLRRKKVKLNG